MRQSRRRKRKQKTYRQRRRRLQKLHLRKPRLPEMNSLKRPNHFHIGQMDPPSQTRLFPMLNLSPTNLQKPMWRLKTELPFSTLTERCTERDTPLISTHACSFTGHCMTSHSRRPMISGSMRKQWKKLFTITCRNRILTSRQRSAQPSVLRG